MAFVTADRVLDTSTSTGTGAMIVSGTAPTGYRTFSVVMSVGDTCYYTIQHATLNEWENGTGTYSSSNTLTRTTVISSSNSNSAVTFSAGSKNVSITLLASKSGQVDPSGASVNAGGGVLAWQTVQTASFTAVAGNAYPVNTTSGAITVTLPASPTAGQAVQLTDYAGTWATNNVTVGPNGSKIGGSTSNLVLSITRESLAFVYLDTTQGWIPYSGLLKSPLPYTVSYLVVAGGGGGGGNGGGGGGAGGLLSGTTSVILGTVYTITVGGGGAAAPQTNTNGTSGSNSVFGSFATSIGGGGGGGFTLAGLSGGSGGGGGQASGTAISGGSGTTGQGNAGGSSSTANTNTGGGGGSSAVGSNGATTVGGAGGAGSASTITGSSVTYAGGGGGGGSITGGAGGAGGGGTGVGNLTAGTAGTANTGGGGGGSWSAAAQAGGSGVVILSIPTINYTGITTGSPAVTTSGSNTIIKFTTSGIYTA